MLKNFDLPIGFPYLFHIYFVGNNVVAKFPSINFRCVITSQLATDSNGVPSYYVHYHFWNAQTDQLVAAEYLHYDDIGDPISSTRSRPITYNHRDLYLEGRPPIQGNAYHVYGPCLICKKYFGYYEEHRTSCVRRIIEWARRMIAVNNPTTYEEFEEDLEYTDRGSSSRLE